MLRGARSEPLESGTWRVRLSELEGQGMVQGGADVQGPQPKFEVADSPE